MTSRALETLYAVHTHFAPLSLQYYLDNVVINSSPEPRAWGLVREPWQDDIIRPKVPMFEALAGLRPDYQGPWRFCDILARGHDKSSLEGRLATWLLLSSRKEISGYIIAADRDQGKLLIAAMRSEALLNPWIDRQLVFAGNEVRGPRGKIEVVPADASGAWGYRGNFFIFDEFTNWRKPVSKEVWKAVMSGTAKVNPAIVGVLSNAGFLGTWQHKIYQDLIQRATWSHFTHTDTLASWMSPAIIAELSEQLGSAAEARRVYKNAWIHAGEDHDYLNMAECIACVNDLLFYRHDKFPGQRDYRASIDYGPKKDRTVLAVGHKDSSGRTIVDKMDVWQGCDFSDGIVPPSKVRQWIKETEKHFDPSEYILDPYGLNSEIEWMKAQHYPTYEYMSRGGKGQFEIAQVLRAQVSSGGVNWYPGCGKITDEDTLETELSQLVTKKKEYGFRIDHESSLHDDRAVCLGMLLVRTTGVA